jgi:hypothetical protein
VSQTAQTAFFKKLVPFVPKMTRKQNIFLTQEKLNVTEYGKMRCKYDFYEK